MTVPLHVITLGRASVDLCGSQPGGRLEDMGALRKDIGGSPADIAAGAAPLGLRAGLITRVGDEHVGRFLCEEPAREGIDRRGPGPIRFFGRSRISPTARSAPPNVSARSAVVSTASCAPNSF